MTAALLRLSWGAGHLSLALPPEWGLAGVLLPRPQPAVPEVAAEAGRAMGEFLVLAPDGTVMAGAFAFERMKV